MAKRKGDGGKDKPPEDETPKPPEGTPEPDKAPDTPPEPATVIPPDGTPPDPAAPATVPDTTPDTTPDTPAPDEPAAEELKTAVLTLHEQNLALTAALKECRRIINARKRNDDKLADSARRMKRLREEAERKKKDSDAAKKLSEQAEAEHIALEEDLRTGQQALPFDDPEEGPTSREAGLEGIPEGSPVKRVIAAKMAEVANEAKADELPPEGPEVKTDLGDPDTVPVEVLGEHGLARKYLKVLIKRGFKTIGDIGRHTASPPEGKGQRLRDIPGIRDTGQDEMISALDSFWAAVREKKAKEAADAPPPAEGEQPPDTAWETLPIETLDIGAGIVDILKRFIFDPVLHTVGGLVTYTSMGNDLTQIPGMTPTRCLTVGKALVKLFQEREKAGLPVPPPPEPIAPPEATTPADDVQPPAVDTPDDTAAA